MINIFKNFKKLKNKIKKNKISLGAWMQIASTDIADIFSSNEKFDWVCVDLEHGNIGYEKLADIFRIIQLNGKIPFARLKSCDEDQAQKVLDLGAMGLIIPKIEKPVELERIIKSANLPPNGNRGYGFFRSNLYGKFFDEYNKQLKKPIIIGMIETVDGLNLIDEILNVKNFDGIFIGPYDLSASLGIVGKFKSKKFNQALKKITNISKDKNKIVGIHVVDNSNKILNENIKKGFKFIAYSMDTVMLSKFN